MDLQPHIARFRSRFIELEKLLSDSAVYDNPGKAQELTKEHSRLKLVLEDCAQWEKATRDLAGAQEMANATDPELAALAGEEVAALKATIEKAALAIRFAVVPPDENDSRNTIVEIRAGTGGDEAGLFASQLFRMYTRYAERVGWKTEIMDISPGERGAVKEVIFQINGADVFKKMRYESGVHRVQRVPATESQGRIHTSTATVAVLPEAKEVDVVIKPDEIRVEVCRSGGPGGQGVNTTDSAVQILHIPTGLIVRCQDGRSQIKNREKAMNVLRSRLLKQKQDEEQAKYALDRRNQIGTGERTEKIRTYNFPQNRITDHRIQYTTHGLPEFMDGNLEPLFEPLLVAALQDKLTQLEKSGSY